MNRLGIKHHCRMLVTALLLHAAVTDAGTIKGCTVASSGGDITGSALSVALAGGNVTLSCSNNLQINDVVTWNATALTLNAQANVNINARMNGSGTAALAIAYGQNAPAANNTGIYSIAAPISLPAGQNFSTTLGAGGTVRTYTVLTALGAAGSVTGTDLQGMNGKLNGSYALGADINAGATSGWNNGQGFVPIGNADSGFSGTLEGLGHTINNITINTPSAIFVGLIGQAGDGAVIRNMGLVGVSIRGASDVGGLVGYNVAGAISNCFSTGSVSGFRRVGGLIGENAGSVTGSYAAGSVTSTGSDAGNGYAFGGLIGKNQGSIDRSHADSVVSGGTGGMANAGGLAGEQYQPGAITNSYATGSVVGGAVNNGMSFGGLVGLQGDSDASGGLISTSYALVNISCTGTPCAGIGGLVGSMGGEGNGSNLGDNGGTVANSYAAGIVTTGSSAQSVGGLVGFMNAGNITNSYWDAVNPNGIGYQPGGTITGSGGLTLAQMQTAGNLAGFVFTTVPGADGWVIVDGDGTLNNANGAAGATLPMLASEYATVIKEAHQLQLMAMAPGAQYLLDNDIDLSVTGNGSGVWGAAGFAPIGSVSTPFTGGFDGRWHTIRNLAVNQAAVSNVGLFGITASGASIQNVGLTGGKVSGNANVGGLVGYLDGGTLANSYVMGSVSGSGNAVGGLVGTGNGAVTNCYVGGSVSGTGNNVGGLVGTNSANGAVIGSYAVASVSGSGNNVGGLIGGNQGNVSSSYWNMTTSGQAVSAGGTGLSSAQMIAMASFSGWNIASVGGSTAVWRIYEGSTYPLLRGFLTPITLMPAYTGTPQTLNNIADIVSSIRNPVSANITGSATGLTLSSSTAAGSYTAAWSSNNLSSNQQGYDIAVISRTVGNVVSKAGDLRIVAPLVWNSGILTLNAQGNIAINASLTLSGTGGVALQYGQGSVAAGNTASYLINAPVNLPSNAATYSTRLGSNGVVTQYTIINTLGTPGSTSGTDLQGLNGNLSGNSALGSDIDATATVGWNSGAGFTPINGFTGSFDGLGHTISNLSINQPAANNIGLFGTVGPNAAIRNVVLWGGAINGGNNVGSLAGYLNGSTISGCLSTARVNGIGDAVGGLIGNCQANSVVSAIVNNYASGAVAGGNDVGGLVGLAGGAAGAVIVEGNYAGGSVSGNNQAGGLTGHLIATEKGMAIIGNSYATGSVSGTANVGGLVGQLEGTAVIGSSYATGKVVGMQQAGGLIGLNATGSVNNSFWNSTASGQTVSAGGQGLNGADMLVTGNFTGFDFKTPVWIMVDGDGTLNNADGAVGATSPMLAAEYAAVIRNGHQLQLMTMAPAMTYTLNTDIDMSATGGTGDVWGSTGFAPVGNYSMPFSGSFDGQGYSIKNLTSRQWALNRAGLFGYIDANAVVQNTTLNNGMISGYGSVGALVGISYGAIANCTSSTTVQSLGGGFVGGMVGSNNGTSSNSQASGAVNSTGGFRGGFAGVNNGTISNCSAVGKVTGRGGYSGQLVGINNGIVR